MDSHAELNSRDVQDRLVKLWNPHRGIAIKTYTGEQQ